VGLFIQQAIALFVLKSGAGFAIFKWIATLAADFLDQANTGAAFFFDAETVAKHWFFVNTVCSGFVLVNTSGFKDLLVGCHHLLCRFRSDDVLSGCYAMDYQTLVSIFLFFILLRLFKHRQALGSSSNSWMFLARRLLWLRLLHGLDKVSLKYHLKLLWLTNIQGSPLVLSNPMLTVRDH
jgi:hypothetical protein